MKKIRILSVLLLVVSTAVFAAFKIYEKINMDQTSPVISFDTEELALSVEAPEADLLKDVRAEDNRSGNVGDSLVVESLSGFTEDGVRVITYAAIDESGNVGRIERTLRYKDYKKPEFDLTSSLRFPKGRAVNMLDRVKAESVLDGDLTGNIKYSLNATVDTTSTGFYAVEFRVMDSGGNVVYLPTELEIYDPSEESMELELTDYLIYLDVNESFDPQDYVAKEETAGDEDKDKNTASEGTRQVTFESGVDTAVPGIYYVNYAAEQNRRVGRNRLIVIVREK